MSIDEVSAALSRVIDPELRRPLTELGMVKYINISGSQADIGIYLTIAGCPMKDRLQEDISKAVVGIADIKSITIKFDVMSDEQRNEIKKIIRGGNEKSIPFARSDSLTRVFAIASGKGGVGKSSVTANLAVALAARGQRVGILDADVYGHSIPRILGMLGARPTAIDNTTFIPPEDVRGIRVASMEMFKPQREDPVAYRGPILHKVLEQLLADAFWGDLDFLLLDLPPGTGDIAISLGQLIPSSELIVVTTPQIAAAEVAERAGRLAHQLKQQVAGVIENMSAFACPHCGELISLFGSGGGEETVARLERLTGGAVPLLGRIPFDPALREAGDSGEPMAEGNFSSRALRDIADQLIQRTNSLAGRRLPLSTH
jgi:ATP-binding protein involved in chromosome partitioning